MAFKLKKDDEGKTIINQETGEPVFIGDDGGEYSFEKVQGDWGQRLATVNNESAERRKEIKALKDVLEPWQSLGVDHEDAKGLIEKAQKIDLSKLTKAEEVEAKIASVTESLKRQMSEAQKVYEATLKDEQTKRTQAESTIHKLVITNSFASSPFFSDRDKTLMSPDVAEMVFGNKLRVEDGHPVCYPDGFDADGEPKGQPMYSLKEPGKPAGFDEAVEKMWEQYPHKDRYTPAIGGGDQTRGGERGKGGPKDLMALAAEAQAKGDIQASIALKNQHFANQKQQGG